MNELIGKLLNPALYSPPVARVELMQTHISWILLAGDFAYKIKKPVDYGFLDFSTLEKRRLFCNEELRLNRRLAPDLYVEVVTIGGAPDDPQFRASGNGIEYAVKMRRFEQAALFDFMLAEGRLDAAHIDSLTDNVAAFHAVIGRAHESDAHGLPEDIQAAALENFAHIYPLLPPSEDGAVLDALHAWTVAQYAGLQPLMLLRKAQGFVRECHGDLHLGNIVWRGERATPFDGIEFSEKLRWIDVVSEIAFTVMDLQAKGRTDLAYRLLNRYWSATGDYGGCNLLRYYLVYRAMVRAKIAMLGLAQAGSGPAKTEHLEQYRRQVGYAQECVRNNTPLLLLCHGLSGSGKSTLAARLTELLPAVHLRSDLERKRLCGLAATSDSRSGPQQGIYSADMTERTYRYLAERAEDLLHAGFSVIVDATFLQLRQREKFKNCAQTQAARFAILDIRTSLTTLRQRIVRRRNEQSDPSEADLAVLEQQMRLQQPLTEQELSSTLEIDGESPDYAWLVAELRTLQRSV